MTTNYSISSPIDLRLPQVPETDDPDMYQQLAKVYNAIRQLQLATTTLTGASQQDPNLWDQLKPTDTIKSQNLNRAYYKSGENIAYGALINIYDLGGGVTGIRNADASSANIKPAHGYCNTSGGIVSGSYGEVILGNGLCVAIGSMIIGSTYYLAATPGGLITNVRPSTPNLGQGVGFALAPGILYMDITMI